MVEVEKFSAFVGAKKCPAFLFLKLFQIVLRQVVMASEGHVIAGIDVAE